MRSENTPFVANRPFYLRGLLAAGLLLSVAVPAEASVIQTLTTVDDTFIRRDDGDASPGTSMLALLKNDVGGNSNFDRNIWIEFDLSSVSGPVTEATFLIDLVNEGIGVDHAIRVGVVVDGDVDEDIDELTLDSTSDLWSDANDEGVNFSKIIGGDQIGEFTISSSDEGTTVSFSDPDLLAAIQDDTNDVLTLVLYRTFNAVPTDSFASKESTTFNPPRLQLTVVPEPSTFVIWSALGLASSRRRRR